ncbi:MAG: tetratricopeptide repeat protein [Lentimicrobium sp.]|jgi:tetratricopeptide (TPR) repeat protein|nr:tetratricopeptide repeat protein [Lentimicrobium sp.]
MRKTWQINWIQTIAGSLLLLLLLPVYNLSANPDNSHFVESLNNKINLNSRDTSAIYMHLLVSRAFIASRNYDSSFRNLNLAIKLSQELEYNRWLYDIYNEYANLMNLSGNFSIELENYFKMLKILDNRAAKDSGSVKLMKDYTELYVKIGLAYFTLENSEKALSYYSMCMDIVNNIYKKDSTYPLNLRMLILYNNIGSVYLTQNNLDKARQNYEQALLINEEIKNQSFYASLFNNMGIIYKTMGDYPKAFGYYNQALDIRTQMNDTAGIAQVYNNLGDCYLLTGDVDKSIEVLNKALDYSKQAVNLTSQLKAANFLTLAYEKASRYKESLEFQRLYNVLKDSINNSDQIRLAGRLEMQYLFEKQQKENELVQEIELAKKQRKALIFMTISGILFSLFVILFLLNRNQKIKMKRNALIQEGLFLESKNLSLEKQYLELEKENLHKELDFRNKELEFRNKELATHVMYLIRKNEFISSITNRLIELNEQISLKNKGRILEIVREMKSNVDNTVWGEFEIRFQQVHNEFYNKLNELHPDLTPNEKKICAFLRLNMTTKDISSITFQTAKSIQVARVRLRKKMGMAQDENLIAFLQQL